MKIFISDSAYADLESIIDYYTKKGVSHIGEQFVTSIIKHIETIPANPDIGRKVPEFNSEQIRELIHVPYRVVYLREDKSIRVIRVWRSERVLDLKDTPVGIKPKT
ncbi:MAG: type II toxin-antitoxin system RelE/ParE family toxin [Alcanivoracaceae bacterium]|nr:type II toxin-antitoxin system RelE/ParE family toxin [Alcanivoracaceae bacterium]